MAENPTLPQRRATWPKWIASCPDCGGEAVGITEDEARDGIEHSPTCKAEDEIVQRVVPR